MHKLLFKIFFFLTLILSFTPIILALCFPRLSLANTPLSIFDRSRSQTFITVLNHKTNVIAEVPLENHLTGVLAAEMPAAYHTEALKAQAVAARSYILSKAQSTNPEHPEAIICTNPNHCKGWISEAEAKAKWTPAEASFNWKKLKSAVADTNGEYMVCDGETVEAFFFASSGGKTENSEDVWGGSRPYLKSVESPGDILSPDHISVIKITASDFSKKLGISAPPIIENISRTEGGSVSTITINKKSFKGTEIRSIFGLKSANFTIDINPDFVTFTVLGYGHGVGMSQTGANYMASIGKKYTEILSHYYTNIQIAGL